MSCALSAVSDRPWSIQKRGREREREELGLKKTKIREDRNVKGDGGVRGHSINMKDELEELCREKGERKWRTEGVLVRTGVHL